MNPYDFARVDWSRPPERRKPVWHHRLGASDGPRLFSGQIEMDLYAETPLFLPARNASSDPKKPDLFLQNAQGQYIIPGSSLKGMLHTVVETLGNGCFTLFDGDYEQQGGRTLALYKEKIKKEFLHCEKNTELCIACRLFGMLKERTNGIFLGKVNISDACTDEEHIHQHDPVYTDTLVGPKPHHRAFYLDEREQYIAGRKFYFHQHELNTASGHIHFSRTVVANRYIRPLDAETCFHFRVHFTNLEEDEFGALLLALTLEEEMRHKIGYGKPVGLGSVCLVPTRLVMVDYTTRYTQARGESTVTLEGNDTWQAIYQHVDTFNEKHLVPAAMDDLRRIWRWPPDPDVDYYYPSKRDWFDTDESIGKRIAHTRNTL